MTLIDLLTAIGFLSPIVGGITAGWKVSAVGAIIGLFIGGFVGFCGTYLGRRVVIHIASFRQTKLSLLLVVLAYTVMLAWTLLGIGIAAAATTAVTHRFRPNQTLQPTADPRS